jgi:AAA domain
MTDEPEGLRIARKWGAARTGESRNGSGLYPVPDPEPPEPPEPPEAPDQPPISVLLDRLLTRSQLRILPDPEPLIDNVLDQGTTALLYGKWGTAKTFIALDWAACVATGRAWQDRPTEQRRVLYVVGEGAFGFKGRIDAWEVGWQTDVSDSDLHILPVPVNLTNAAEVNNLRALVDWGGYSMVVLDTLARCMVGADENSARDCGIVVDAVTRVLASTPGQRGVVLGVHHAGKDGKTLRGSSAFEAAADTVYFTARDGGVITLDRQKRKDGPETDSHQLEIDPMPGTSSAVISRARSVPPEGGTTARAEQLYSIFVQSFSGIGATKTELRTAAAEAEVSTGSFYRALSDLVESGRLVNTGTEARPFYKQAS